MKDIEIINGIIEGNSEYEKILFEKYDQKIRYIVYSKLNYYRSYVVDIVQDIKISVLLSIRNGNFKHESELSLGAYIYGISMNKISDFVRKNQRENDYVINQVRQSEKSYTVAYTIEDEEIKNTLRKAVKKLKLKYQEILYLKFFDELSVKEISEKIKLPPRRVSERINYALKLIKKELEKTRDFA